MPTQQSTKHSTLNDTKITVTIDANQAETLAEIDRTLRQLQTAADAINTALEALNIAVKTFKINLSESETSQIEET